MFTVYQEHDVIDQKKRMTQTEARIKINLPYFRF